MEENTAVETNTEIVKKPSKQELAQQEADQFKLDHPEGEQAFYGDGPFPVLSRAAAILLGYSRYNLGTPCNKGHNSPRKVKTSACIACNRDKLKARKKERLQSDPEYKATQAQKAKDRRARNKPAKPAAEAEAQAQ